MNNALKSLQNNALASLRARAPQGVINAIQTASAKTGVSFSYLMEKANAESSFDANAKAKTSSATGLFQFIESTWMDMVEKHGDKYGIDSNQPRKDLLNLRKNPEIASVMAAEFASDNKAHLEKTVGGDIGNTELYFAHFMGAGGASAFLSQHQKNPLSIGADLFPTAANANRNVFYDSKTGAPKTLEEIYQFFDKKFTNDDGTKKTANAPDTMAHKPEGEKAGYQHIPFSLKKPVQILQGNTQMSATDLISNSQKSQQARNSIYDIQNQIENFFSQPIAINSPFPSSFYGNLSSPTTMLLDILRD